MTKRLLLAIPGYLKLSDSDYAVFDNSDIGRGNSAVINRGVLIAEFESKHGFKDVAVKTFRGTQKMNFASLLHPSRRLP